VAFSALNYFGARPGAAAIDLFTVAKFSVLLVMIVALLPHASLPVASVAASSQLPAIGAISAATFMAVFAAQGFEVVPVPAGETQAARRNVPLAIMASLIASSVLYIVVQSTLALAYPKLGDETSTPLGDAAAYVAPWLGALVTFGGLVSTLGFVSGSALGTPRYLFAAAEDGHLPRRLATLHPRFDSPHVATLATSALAIALLIPFDYRSLIGMSNVAVAVQYIGTCLAVLPLRKRDGATGISLVGRAAPYVGTAMSIWICTEANGTELLWAGASLALGLLLRAVTKS
jgi:APA family basic amino acid/polyamine antiporter